jgi:phosphate uptake regulator
MSTPPDAAMETMAEQLAAGAGRLDEALRAFTAGRREEATEIADRAIKDQRHVQHTYRAAISALLENEDLREVTARRELYRRLARTGDELARVAEQIWYSVLKED